MLTKVLSATVLVLFLSLCGLGYMHSESLKENGRLSGEITTLKDNLEKCEKSVKDAEGAKEDVVVSFENVVKKNAETELAFKELEDRLKNKRCGVTTLVDKSKKDENNVSNDPIADDIADTFGVLRRAYCLSNGDPSCQNP